MKDAIKNFYKQFEWDPEVENQEKLGKFDRFILAGMGGSGLVGGLLKTWNPYLKITVHKDYGLPAQAGLPEELSTKGGSASGGKNTLIFANSYSGNTEETIDVFEKAEEKDLARAVISTGGKLLELTKKERIPFVQMPDTGIQPRLSLGFQMKALLKIIGEEEALEEIGELSQSLKPEEYEDAGQGLAQKLKGFVPIIYSSIRNSVLAYNWKIGFNETAKIPAFYNVFPECNHNEIEADYKNFFFIFLKDKNDHPAILKRIGALEKLYVEKGLPVKIIELKGENPFHKIFSSIILADWTAYYTAEQQGIDPEQIPVIEEFKRLIT